MKMQWADIVMWLETEEKRRENFEKMRIHDIDEQSQQ